MFLFHDANNNPIFTGNKFMHEADFGVTEIAGAVTSIVDRNGISLTQNTAANQPTYNATGWHVTQ